MYTNQAAAQKSDVSAGYIQAVEAPKELARLASNVSDVIGLASKAAAELEDIANALGLYEPAVAGGNAAAIPQPPPSGAIDQLHDAVHTARCEVSRIHRVIERLHRLI